MGSPSNGQDTVGQGAGEAKTAREWIGLKIGWSGQESNYSYDGLSHKGKKLKGLQSTFDVIVDK